MATLAPQPPDTEIPLPWFREFLKEELAPYPGRVALVFRVVTATVLVMIMVMTFRIPYGAFGAYFAFLVSRENPRTIVSVAGTTVVAFAAGGAFVLVGEMLVVNYPMLRFLWVIFSFLTAFYALSAMRDYSSALRFGYFLVLGVPLWDQQTTAESRVESTLWVLGALGLATIVATLVQLAFAGLRPADEIVRAVVERLESVERLLLSHSENRPLDEATAKDITRLAMVGTSRVWRLLETSAYSPQYRQQMGAVIALSGRLIDIAANVEYLEVPLSDDDRNRIRNLATHIASIRTALLNKTTPQLQPPASRVAPPRAIPLLGEMETTVCLIPQVFAGAQSLEAYPFRAPVDEPSPSLFVPDALTNKQHLQFALKGCLAASLCYVIYTALFWPGISTSVATCLLTALTTVGASHQKQVLRISGAVVGGFGLGMGAQIFILPHLDSIAALTVLVIFVCAPVAWVATSSPRLSYCGAQMALAFFLVNLSEFRIQTSLAVARDRVVGVMLGLTMMWLAFDRLWVATAGVEMKRAFIATLRLFAQFAREPVSPDPKVAIPRGFELRETINSQFSKVKAFADGVLFEFGPARRQDLALRARIRRWMPQLQTLFSMRIALFKYRLQLPGFELPEAVRQAQEEFDAQLARRLERMADRLEGGAPAAEDDLESAFARLEEAVRAAAAAAEPRLAANLETFLTLSRMAESLIVSLDAEVA